MTEFYDVAVVGGGPAGTGAALEAASAGLSVVLLEKEPEIATTVRTSGVTWTETVQEFGIPDHCYNPVQNYGFCSPDRRVIVRDKEPRAVVLDVRATYRWLADKAQNAGSQIRTDTTIHKATRSDTGMHLSGSGPDGDVCLDCAVAVDASGFGSVISKSMGLASPWRRFGAGAEYEVHVQTMNPHTWWLMVGSIYSPAGYAWIFPTGEDTARIGVGVAKPECKDHPKDILDSIMRERRGPVEDLGRIDITEYHYGLIPNDGIGRRTAYDNILLVGDAAGQANPLVLEGIRYAIRFGRLAGKTAASAIHLKDTSYAALRSYETGWREAVGSKIKSAYRVQNRWLSLNDAQWSEELDILDALSTDEFLDFVKADFGFSRMAQMAARHPRLAVRQLLGLVRRLK